MNISGKKAVVFGGTSGIGLATTQMLADGGATVWAIGVDSDQYTVPSLAEYKDIILTSMLKRVDVAVYDVIVRS